MLSRALHLGCVLKRRAGLLMLVSNHGRDRLMILFCAGALKHNWLDCYVADEIIEQDNILLLAGMGQGNYDGGYQHP